MAILPIFNCFHPVLKKKTEKVANINEEIKKLVDDLFETMYLADGVGLAANQVGSMKSIFVVDTKGAKTDQIAPPYVMINPQIISYSDETIDYQEGCLSIPKFYEDVSRPEIVQIKFLDLNEHEHIIEADDFLARVIQHEYDHLNGILFYERLSPVRRALSKSKLRRIEKGEYEADYPMILPNGKPYIKK